MTKDIDYGKRCRNLTYGRNRYITTGLRIAIHGNELILSPIRGGISKDVSPTAASIPLPMTAAPAVADALISAATPTLHDQLGYWPPPNAEKAITACRLLVIAYQRGEKDGGSVDWSDLDDAFALAAEAIHMPTREGGQ